jgi:hypothetical protein
MRRAFQVNTSEDVPDWVDRWPVTEPQLGTYLSAGGQTCDVLLQEVRSLPGTVLLVSESVIQLTITRGLGILRRELSIFRSGIGKSYTRQEFLELCFRLDSIPLVILVGGLCGRGRGRWPRR